MFRVLHRSIGVAQVMTVVATVGTLVGSPTFARETRDHLSWSRAPRPGELVDDQPRASSLSPLRADTLTFGYVDGDGFAIQDELWTWDHGGPDPLEGWVGLDVTFQTATYFRQITSTIWTTGTGNTVPAPILSGAGSAWVGAFENEADALCWQGGLGYGNTWRQRLVSPPLTYTGSGSVTLQFEYFNDSEPDFDYTKILLRLGGPDNEVPILDPGFTGEHGLATNHPASPPTGASFSTTITPAHFGSSTSFQIVFEFSSDGGWSDEDGAFNTAYAPFGVDDVSLSGAGIGTPVSYAFETGLNGWTPEIDPPTESDLGVNDISEYGVEGCVCNLSGNILEFHDDDFEHPEGQHIIGQSNPVDMLNDVTPVLGGGSGFIAITADWDQYSVMPRANGVFYRPGWDYYPFVCPASGATEWSGRVGQENFFYVGNDPLCTRYRNFATSNGIPGLGVEQVRFLFEVYSSCDAFGIPPDICTETTNETPIIDNAEIRFHNAPIAPPIAFATGTRYRDGFAQTEFLDPDGVGRADIVSNVNFGDGEPWIQGDSLYVSGPSVTTSTRWESRLWFRISREGPGTKPPSYNSWKTAIADGRNITGGEFTFAWMDSFQLGTQTTRNKFVSYLRETGEDDYNSGAGEQSGPNEIIRDDVLVAGSRIDYFITSNYTATLNENFTLPDTSGQFFNEFAILPTWENVDAVFRFPCLLYVDAYNAGAEAFIEAALDQLGQAHDRFDYLDASAGWRAPMVRGPAPSNSGATLSQLLGYRTILINTGIYQYAMWPADWNFFSDWLTALHCEGSSQRQGIVLNGDGISTILEQLAPAVLQSLGGGLTANEYRTYAGDENYCVRLEVPSGALYGTSNSMGEYDYDAYGNWCPDMASFDVLAPTGAGVGNRTYVNVSTLDDTNYAQVVKEDNGTGNFRSVLDGVSYHHLALRSGVEECTSSFDNIVGATKNEIASALEWIFDGDVPTLCENPCSSATDAPDGPTVGVAATTRLYAGAPNPFHPRTTLRFSLAQTARAELAIFDAAGRKVRTLVQGEQSAGLHEVVWDGTSEQGHVLPAGVYWSQLTTDEYSSSKKLVLLK